MRTKFLKANCKAGFIFVFAICIGAVRAEDERSIHALRDALVTLAPGVDPREAELLSVKAHTMSRRLAREYRVTLNPEFHNFLINIGARQRGYCAHYARDIGSRLKDFKLKTLVLHWGAAYANERQENNCLVVTARHQHFEDGIVLDGWRDGGRLFWCPVKKDHEYAVEHHGGRRRSAISEYDEPTAWKEDLQETAWLQDNRSGKAKRHQ